MTHMLADTRTRILVGALDLLREGGSVSLESAAERVGLTKPGLMYHFRTKEALMVGLVDHVVDGWEAELVRLVGSRPEQASADARIRAYLDFALTTNFDETDMVILSDPRLRNSLSTHWEDRMAPWVELPAGLDDDVRSRFLAVRLLADGAWFASAANVLAPEPAERERVRAVAHELLRGMT